jgi:hypothetical protein
MIKNGKSILVLAVMLAFVATELILTGLISACDLKKMHLNYNLKGNR